MLRTIQPELLDSLPPHHPDALHNRRDLRVTNRFMGNYRWVTDTLVNYARPSEPILEIGAGTGELACHLHSRGLAVDGLDLWPQPEAWPASQRWHQADVRTFTGYGAYPVIVANLLLHQFSDEELAVIGAAITPTARAVVACEPMRRRVSQFFYRVLGPMFGANHVSLHDAHVSINAGFVGAELPSALGLRADSWDLQYATTVRGAYHLVAVRRP